MSGGAQTERMFIALAGIKMLMRRQVTGALSTDPTPIRTRA
jgi:hypothetical protein